MNKGQIVAGWMLLCGLTAAGTFFAADELDQRFDLQKQFHLAQLGPAGAPPAALPGTPGNTTPPASSANIVPSTPPASQVGPATGQQSSTQPGQPSPSPQQGSQAAANAIPAQQGNSAASTIPPRGNYAPPASNVSPPILPTQQGQRRPLSGNGGYTPAQGGGIPAAPAPQVPVPSQTGPRPTSDRDLGLLRDRYNDLVGRATEVDQYWRGIEKSIASLGQSLRPQIAAARISMKEHMNSAAQGLRAGDADGAKRSMDAAEAKIRQLDQARNE